MGTKPAPALDPSHHEGPGAGQTTPPLSAPTPGAHWSKDFVEHLRTVHFTLIAVAVGLIFLSFPRYDVNAALNDLESIIRLKKDWSLELLRDLPSTGGHTYGKILDKNEKQVSDKMISAQALGIEVVSNGKARSFRLPKNNWLISDEAGNIAVPASGRLNADFVNHFPDTVAEFENWWNDLRRGDIYVNYPEKISADVTQITDGQKLPPSSDQLEIRWQTDNGKDILGPDIKFKYYFYDATQNLPFIILITTTSFPVTQGAVHDKLSGSTQTPAWNPKTFQATFPELAKASVGSEQLSLEDLDARLKQEAAKGPETLDIFGLKIPATQSAAFLLVIQLYFVVTLKELHRKLSPQDACWDVRWLGMYQDRLSRLLYVLTTGILPAFVIVLLFRQTLRSFGSWFRHVPVGSSHAPSPAAANIVGVCVALILSIIFGWLSWKYRPQVGSA